MRRLGSVVYLAAFLAGVHGASTCLDSSAGKRVFKCAEGTTLINLGSSCGITDADVSSLRWCFENAGRELIKEIYITDSSITALPEDVFQGLDSLEALYLSGNAFTELDESMFSNLASLQILRLNGCSLTSLPEGLFSGLVALKTLCLQDNNFESLPTALLDDDLEALDKLDLSRNSLGTLPASSFQNLLALSTLNLSGNKLSVITPGVFPGTLKQLYLADNALGQGALDPGTFGGLGEVETLTLTNNGLGSLPAGLFDGLVSLTILGLGENFGLQCVPSTEGSPSLTEDKLILPSNVTGGDGGGVCPCPGVEVCDDCIPGDRGYVCTGCGEKARECQLDRTCQECRIPANSQEQQRWDSCLAQYEYAATCSSFSAEACCFDELSENDCQANDAFVAYSTCLLQVISADECTSLSCRDTGNIVATIEEPETDGGRHLRAGLGSVAVASVLTGLCVAAGAAVG